MVADPIWCLPNDLVSAISEYVTIGSDVAVDGDGRRVKRDRLQDVHERVLRALHPRRVKRAAEGNRPHERRYRGGVQRRQWRSR